MLNFQEVQISTQERRKKLQAGAPLISVPAYRQHRRSSIPRYLHFQREWPPDPDFVAGLVNGAGWIRGLKYKSEDNPPDFGISLGYV